MKMLLQIAGSNLSSSQANMTLLVFSHFQVRAKTVNCTSLTLKIEINDIYDLTESRLHKSQNG